MDSVLTTHIEIPICVTVVLFQLLENIEIEHSCLKESPVIKCMFLLGSSQSCRGVGGGFKNLTAFDLLNGIFVI